MLDLKLSTESQGIHGKFRRMEVQQLKGDAEMKRSKSKKRGKAYLDSVKKAQKEYEKRPILVKRVDPRMKD